MQKNNESGPITTLRKTALGTAFVGALLAAPDSVAQTAGNPSFVEGINVSQSDSLQPFEFRDNHVGEYIRATEPNWGNAGGSERVRSVHDRRIDIEDDDLEIQAGEFFLRGGARLLGFRIPRDVELRIRDESEHGDGALMARVAIPLPANRNR